MEFTAQSIAQIIHGTIVGNPDSKVHSLAKIEEAEAGSLAFLDNEKYIPYIYTTKASIVLVNESFEPEEKINDGTTLIKVANARMAFAGLLEEYAKQRGNKTGVSNSAIIHESASIGSEVYIGDGVIIGENSVIGDGVKIYPGTIIGDNVKVKKNSVLYYGVRVYSDSVIGEHCTLQGGCVIGGDGFGFQPNQENNYHKVVHIGNVIVHDWVEVGSNTTIDKGTLGSTIIGKGVKLDNLIQIAHNVEIGENTVIAAQTGVAGSTTIGKNCMIGGQVGIIGHLNIADGSKIAAQSGVGQDITEENAIVQGSPAFGIGDYKRSYVLFRGLPKLKEDLDELKKNS